MGKKVSKNKTAFSGAETEIERLPEKMCDKDSENKLEEKMQE